MHSFKTLLSRFAKDEDASITMEFVIVTPVMVLWWIGSMVFFDAFEARSGAARSAYTIADLISRQTETTNSYIDTLLVLQNRMRPREPVGTVRVTEIYRDASGDLSVVWSYSTSGLGSALLVDDIPLGIMPILNNESYVMLIDTTIPYIPLSDIIGIPAQTWNNRIYINPRFTDQIPNPDV